MRKNYIKIQDKKEKKTLEIHLLHQELCMYNDLILNICFLGHQLIDQEWQ